MLILSKPENRVAPHLLHGHRPRALPAARRSPATPCCWKAIVRAPARQDGQPEGRRARGRPGGLRGADDLRARAMRPPRRALSARRRRGRPAAGRAAASRRRSRRAARAALPRPRPLQVRRLLAQGGGALDRGRPRVRGRRGGAGARAPDRSAARRGHGGRAPRGRRRSSARDHRAAQAAGLHHHPRRPRRPRHRVRAPGRRRALGVPGGAARQGHLRPPRPDQRPPARPAPDRPRPRGPQDLPRRGCAACPPRRCWPRSREGVDIGDGGRPRARPQVRSLGSSRRGGTWLEIVLTEGQEPAGAADVRRGGARRPRPRARGHRRPGPGRARGRRVAPPGRRGPRGASADRARGPRRAKAR